MLPGVGVGFWLRAGAILAAVAGIAWGVWAFCDWQQDIGAARVQAQWDKAKAAALETTLKLEAEAREKEAKAGQDREAKDAEYVAEIDKLKAANRVLATDGDRLRNSLRTALNTLRETSAVPGAESAAYAAAEQLADLYQRADGIAERGTAYIRELESQVTGLQEYADGCHRFTNSR